MSRFYEGARVEIALLRDLFSTRDNERLARDPAPIFRCQEDNGRTDVVRLPYATERSELHVVLLHRTIGEAGSDESFGHDDAWID